MRREPNITGTPVPDKAHWPSKEQRVHRGLYVDPDTMVIYIANAMRDFVPLSSGGGFVPDAYLGKGTRLDTDLSIRDDLKKGQVLGLEDGLNHVAISSFKVVPESGQRTGLPPSVILRTVPTVGLPMRLDYRACSNGQEWDGVLTYFNPNGWNYKEGFGVEGATPPEVLKVTDWTIDSEDSRYLELGFNIRNDANGQLGEYNLEMTIDGVDSLTYQSILNRVDIDMRFRDLVLAGLYFNEDQRHLIISGLNVISEGTPYYARATNVETGVMINLSDNYVFVGETSPFDGFLVADTEDLEDGTYLLEYTSKNEANQSTRTPGYFGIQSGYFTKDARITRDIGLTVLSQDDLSGFGETVKLQTTLPQGHKCRIRVIQVTPEGGSIGYVGYGSMSFNELVIEADGTLPIIHIRRPGTDYYPLAKHRIDVITEDGAMSTLDFEQASTAGLNGPGSALIAGDSSVAGSRQFTFNKFGAQDITGIESIAVNGLDVPLTFDAVPPEDEGSYWLISIPYTHAIEDRVTWDVVFTLTSGYKFKHSFVTEKGYGNQLDTSNAETYYDLRGVI